MNILALDAALSSCSSAVITDDKIISEIFENRLRGHAERLVPMCQEACEAASMSLSDMDYIAVSRGPGTFTGVRIGLAAAKGLALALGIPLIGVTTLEAVAQNAFDSLPSSFSGRIAVAHDARRSEVYLQLFENKQGKVIAISAPLAVPLCDVASHLLSDVQTMVGTGIGLIKPLLPKDNLDIINFLKINDQPNAGTIGRMAAEKLGSGEILPPVVPLYLRAPDAIAAKPVIYPFQNQ